MKFTLRQLQVFLATAHHENISQAAQSLNMSQSAASESLKTLESHFNMRFFERHGKTLKLNEMGRQFWPRVESLLVQAETLEKEFISQPSIGTLKVGATLTIGNYLLVPLIAEYMSKFGESKVELHVHNTTKIVEDIVNFELDVGLIEGEINHPQLLITPWREDELIPFCSASHPLAKKSQLSDQDLMQAEWIMRESGSGTRQTFERAMHGLMPKLNIALELEHTEAIKRAVSTGFGISCLSKVCLEDAFDRGELVPLNVPDRNFRRDFYVIMQKQKYLSKPIMQWLKLCGLSHYPQLS